MEYLAGFQSALFISAAVSSYVVSPSGLLNHLFKIKISSQARFQQTN